MRRALLVALLATGTVLLGLAYRALGPPPPSELPELGEVPPPPPPAAARGRRPLAPPRPGAAIPRGSDGREELGREPGSPPSSTRRAPVRVEIDARELSPCDAGRIDDVLGVEGAEEVCARFRAAERELLTEAALDPEAAADPDGVAAVWAELRAELGEEGYAAALYAVGRPNRVVLGASEAPLPSGLEPGDALLAVDDERVFSVEELERRLEAGARIVTVRRGDEEISLELESLSAPLSWAAESVPPSPE